MFLTKLMKTIRSNLRKKECLRCSQYKDHEITHTVFCRIHAPPQIDAPPKFLDHVREVSSSKIYMTTLFNDWLNAVLTIRLLHSMK